MSDEAIESLMDRGAAFYSIKNGHLNLHHDGSMLRVVCERHDVGLMAMKELIDSARVFGLLMP